MLRLSLAAAALALSLGGCSCVVGSQQGYAPEQPLAYSHARHAGELQMDCQYCHFGASRSRHAGIPPLQVCMNCHTQVRKELPEVIKLAEAVASNRPIQWVKVHRLPDHAYFSHRSHVAGGRLTCQQCHGPVETMVRVAQVERMTMGWCLDCHRLMAPQAAAATTECSSCHH